MECFVCRKHAGEVAPPPGGYLYEDWHWRVCHGPRDMALAGQLIVESRRHFLDFAAMTTDEATSIGPLLGRLIEAIKRVTGAERVYALAMMDGEAHFHVWLVPRPPGAPSRGMAFLAAEHACTEEQAVAAAAALRAALG